MTEYTVHQDLVIDTSVYLGCVSLRKSTIGFLDPKESDFAFLFQTDQSKISGIMVRHFQFL